MFAQIAHEIQGRIRLATGRAFTSQEANALHYLLMSSDTGVSSVRIYQKTGSVTLTYQPEARSQVLNVFECIKRADLEQVSVPLSSALIIDENEYPERIASLFLWRTVRKILIPAPIRNIFLLFNVAPFIWEGIKALGRKELNVSVLDAIALTFSLIIRDFSAAGEIVLLLKIGEIFEEWTERKSQADLAHTLMDIDEMVWVEREGEQLLVSLESVAAGETLVLRMGYAIPLDGVVIKGEGQVNMSSLTGESHSVTRSVGDSVYAGTVLEEGELFIQVTATSQETRLGRIMHMIDDATNQKSELESRVSQLADSVVPYNLAFGAGVGLVTRDLTKTSAAFVVDYSCALSMTTSISVLSAMREGAARGFTIKGGKQLEQLAEADTIVFDKTGTLTCAKPQVTHIISLDETMSETEVLRLSACLEEHFPHPVAHAIVQAAIDQNLSHREKHADVEYIVAHGIVSSLDGQRVLIGSPHFVFDDEGIEKTARATQIMKEEAGKSSVLFLAVGNKLAGALILEDPLREDAKLLVDRLRATGFSRIVMLTGDAEAAAAVAATAAGVDEYRAQMLPEQKAAFIAQLKSEGCKVVMVGDGVNDSLALATADVGIAMNNGADVAREVADITLNTSNIQSIVVLRQMSKKLFKRLNSSYTFIIAANTLFLGLGVAGILSAAVSALLHNGTTIGLALSSMRCLMDDKDVYLQQSLTENSERLLLPEA